MLGKIYKTIIGASTTLGTSIGFYCGCKMGEYNMYDNPNMSTKDIIGETLCFSMVVLGNTMNGALLGCVSGVFFPLTSLGIYTLYSQLQEAKEPGLDINHEIKNMNDEINNEITLSEHPYNRVK